MTLLWKKPSWPSFNWSNSELIDQLVKARFEQGRVLAINNPFVHSFEIADRTQALYEDLMFGSSLSVDRLHGWQASLFPTGYSGVRKVRLAHFREKDLSAEAYRAASVPYAEVESNMQTYLSWWAEPPVNLDPLIHSALAFFWFLSVSPYEDGNYTLACALSELSLQQSERSKGRLYDLSVVLQENRNEVLKEIDKAQMGNGDLTRWIHYFLGLYMTSTQSAFSIASYDRTEAEFWKSLSNYELNNRQKKILKFFFDSATTVITNREYVSFTQTSRESAKRDLKKLVDYGLLKQTAVKGRSIKYLYLNSTVDLDVAPK